MPEQPGTVSQILWHFTGGPRWNERARRQNTSPKPAARAYEALLAILQSNTVRLGGYGEVVKVHVPEARMWDQTSRMYRTLRNIMWELKTAPVCCLADIPIAHLSYHAARYGKFAIGFHRDAAVRAGFNPVFYTLQSSQVIRTIREQFAGIRLLDLTSSAEIISNLVTGLAQYAADGDISRPDRGVQNLIHSIGDAKAAIAYLFAFVKTFAEDEFENVYCEREWRAVTNFVFTDDDMAMIVLPKQIGTRKYFERFVAAKAAQLGLPDTIPVVPWETLLES